MTATEIEAFLTVVRWGSLSAAAEQLYITQPALSRRLRSLEEELRCTLFRRGRGQRGVELTEAGRAFTDIALRWQNLSREAEELEQAVHRERLRLAAIPSVGSGLLLDIFRRYAAHNPQAQLAFHIFHSKNCYQSVEDGASDLALVSNLQFSRTIATVPLFREEMFLIAPRGLYGEEPVDPQQLDPAHEIFAPWNPEFEAWHGAHFRRGPHLYFDEISMIPRFMDDNAWIIAPASALDTCLAETHRLYALAEGPQPRIIYGLFRTHDLPPILRSYLQLVRQSIDRTPGMTAYEDSWEKLIPAE